MLLILDCRINRHQQKVIEYLCAKYKALKEKLGRRRILIGGLRRLAEGSLPTERGIVLMFGALALRRPSRAIEGTK